MDKAVEGLPCRVRFHTAISNASIARSDGNDFDNCQPTTMRENTSVMNAA